MKKNNRLSAIVLCLTAFVAAIPATAQVKNPSDYGRVKLDSYSSKAGLGPVVFDHWLHRSKYTCRVCHVDIGFAMKANGSEIRAKTNREGYHCGACHDGKKTYKGTTIFKSCSEGTPDKQCARCHASDSGARKFEYSSFTANFPKSAYGIDWEEAESLKLITPVDTVEGISIQKPALKTQEDFALKARVTWVSDIVFSHKKHTIWNGCELCHPDIFPATQKGANRYTMFHISGGQYCGVCHGKVAFPVQDCHSCHRNIKGKDQLVDSVTLAGPTRAPGFGSVKFMHKTHVGDRQVKCEICHHPVRTALPRTGPEQDCSSCHTHNPEPPVKTNLQAAFHNQGATAGVCIDCHKKANAENSSNDIEFVRMMLPRQQGTIDIARAQLVYGKDAEMRQLAQEIIHDRQSEASQMEAWLKQRDADTWAPVKCHDCHKKPVGQ